MGASRSEPLVRRVLDLVRARAIEEARWRPPGRFGPLSSAGRVALSLSLVILNWLAHGVLMLRLRYWTAATALLAGEALGVILVVQGIRHDRGNATLGGLALLATTWLVGCLAPLGILLRDWRERRPEPGSSKRTLTIVLLGADAILPGTLVHGALHAAAGRYRRALAIFATELAGLTLLYFAVTPRTHVGSPTPKC